MTVNRIVGIALATVFLTVAAPAFAGCSGDDPYDYKSTENENSKPITAEKDKPAPTVDTAGTEDKG